MPSIEQWQKQIASVRATWGTEEYWDTPADERAWFARYARGSITPGGLAAELETYLHTDVTTILPAIHVPTLVERGAVVILEVPAALLSLLESVGNVSRIVVQGEPRPDFDLYCPLLSLPLRLGTTLDTIPAQTPYLVVDQDKVDAWRARLAGERRLKVALVWSGKADHQRNPFRAVGLQAYAAEVTRLREKGRPTVPTTLCRELRTNPFLRADDPAMQARWGGGDPVETFAALRSAKDNF